MCFLSFERNENPSVDRASTLAWRLFLECRLQPFMSSNTKLDHCCRPCPRKHKSIYNLSIDIHTCTHRFTHITVFVQQFIVIHHTFRSLKGLTSLAGKQGTDCMSLLLMWVKYRSHFPMEFSLGHKMFRDALVKCFRGRPKFSICIIRKQS